MGALSSAYASLIIQHIFPLITWSCWINGSRKREKNYFIFLFVCLCFSLIFMRILHEFFHFEDSKLNEKMDSTQTIIF